MREAKKRRSGADLASDVGVFWPFSCSPQTPPLWSKQPSSEQVQVRQRKAAEEPGGVLGQTAITHLGKAPQVLHHVESMLPARPGRRAQAVEPLLCSRQRITGLGTAVDAVAHAPLTGGLPVQHAPVGLVAVEFPLLSA